jgi:ribonuclease HI
VQFKRQKNELTRALDTYQAKGFKVAKLVTDSEEVFMSITSVVEHRGVAPPQSIRPLSSTALSQYNPVFE